VSITATGAGAVARAIDNIESAAVIAATARSRTATRPDESCFSCSDAATATAAFDACLGTRMNAISAPMNTRPPTIPMIAIRRDAFNARADVHR
jgi:hypothetical protein